MRKLFSLFLIGLSICGFIFAFGISDQVPGFWMVSGAGTDGSGAVVAIREFLRIGISFTDANETAMGDVFGGMSTSWGEGAWRQIYTFGNADPNDFGFSFLAPVWNAGFTGVRKCIIRARMNSANAFSGNFESDLYDSNGTLIATVQGPIQGSRTSLTIDANADASKLPTASGP